MMGLALAPMAGAQPGGQPETVLHARAQLLAETQAIRPGRPFRVGLHMLIDRGWHINWKNPGDAGLAPRLSWTLPPGFVAGPIEWPCPELIREPSLAGYGYTDETLLPVLISPPGNLQPGDTVDIRLEAEWLECSELCVPGRATLQLTLPIASGEPPPVDPRWSRAEGTVRDRMPVPPSETETTASAEISGREIVLHLEAMNLAVPDSVEFFAGARGLIDHAAPQRWSVDGNRLTVRLSRPRNTEGDPDTLEGVLFVAPGLRGPGSPQVVAIMAVLPTAGHPGWAVGIAVAVMALIVLARARIRRKRAHELGANRG